VDQVDDPKNDNDDDRQEDKWNPPNKTSDCAPGYIPVSTLRFYVTGKDNVVSRKGTPRRIGWGWLALSSSQEKRILDYFVRQFNLELLARGQGLGDSEEPERYMGDALYTLATLYQTVANLNESW